MGRCGWWTRWTTFKDFNKRFNGVEGDEFVVRLRSGARKVRTVKLNTESKTADWKNRTILLRNEPARGVSQ